MSMKTILLQGLTELRLELNDSQVDSLLAYQALIQKWTQVYNLTAVRDPAEMLTHHLFDSLAVVQPLRRQLACLMPESGVDRASASGVSSATTRLLDVGSGAGLPGVVIAICCPDITVHCVDTVAKKAAFVQQVAAVLKLPRLRGIHARVENLTDRYQVISSRAFASLADFCNWSAQALAEPGIWLAMKGKYPVDEIAALPARFKVFQMEQLSVPGLAAERCIVWLK